jgi:purine nucleosidase
VPVSVAAGLIFVSAYAPMARRIVLDTDMGTDVDDALCLGLALAAPELELVAVTHVSRDTRLRARISKKLLRLAGRENVPVYAGCEKPRSGRDTFAWFGHEGEGILDAGEDLEIEAEPAVAALSRLFRSASDLELVAIGPLTNVAAALDADPDLARRIARLTVMGGHIRRVAYGGCDLPRHVDYNLCSDPDASLRVLSAGIPTRLVTADVTLQVWIGEGDLRGIESVGSPLHRALARAVRRWTPIMNRIFTGLGARMDADNVAFLHDPLALACVYDESFCTFEDLAVEPMIRDGVFRTIERSANGEAGRDGHFPRLRCATAVDAGRFRSHFTERLKSLGQ